VNELQPAPGYQPWPLRPTVNSRHRLAGAYVGHGAAPWETGSVVVMEY